MTTYNINPLAIPKTSNTRHHYALAEYAGIVLPPLTQAATGDTETELTAPLLVVTSLSVAEQSVLAGTLSVTTSLSMGYYTGDTETELVNPLEVGTALYATDRLSLSEPFTVATSIETAIDCHITALKYIDIDAHDLSRLWDVSSAQVVGTVYLCTLDGPEELELDTLELPISSLQARLRDGEPSYIGVVVPTVTDALVEAIQARDGGTLTVHTGVKRRDGTTVTEILFEGDFYSMRYDKGARSGSITLVGYVTETTTTSKSVDLTGISTEGMLAEDSKKYVRCEPSFFLRPGDLAIWGDDPDDQAVAGLITITVTPHNGMMEVRER